MSVQMLAMKKNVVEIQSDNLRMIEKRKREKTHSEKLVPPSLKKQTLV